VSEVIVDPRRPLTAPPSWLPLLEPAQDHDDAGAGAAPFPGPSWPKLEHIDYMSKLITLILLLLALPWLLDRLLTKPGEVPAHSAHLAGAPSPGPGA
jgi:hypothetical protein